MGVFTQPLGTYTALPSTEPLSLAPLASTTTDHYRHSLTARLPVTWAPRSPSHSHLHPPPARLTAQAPPSPSTTDRRAPICARVCEAGGRGGATETPGPVRAHVNEASARGEGIAAPRLRAAPRGAVRGGRACEAAPPAPARRRRWEGGSASAARGPRRRRARPRRCSLAAAR